MPSADERRRFQEAHNSLKTIAVTGTNGKTSTVSMIDSIVAASGEASARLTTLGSFIAGAELDLESKSTEFLQTVEAAMAAGAHTLALEVTSKALVKGWAQEWPAHVAVFTNISRDHMDMHRSPESYLAAKAQLFMTVPPQGHCVLNAADPNVSLLAETIPKHAQVHYYDASGASTASASLKARTVETSRDGLVIDFEDSELARSLGGSLAMPIVGEVHASNALAAALAAHCSGYDSDAIVAGLTGFAGVPGRFEVVGRSPFTVIDYAHTPDGLQGTLATAKSLLGQGGALHLVFGCGGERDQGKRKEMGRVAHEMADRVVLTNDNPRRENPDRIAEQIREGAIGTGAIWSLCLDRPEAVRETILAAGLQDIVVVAGKGHEEWQESAGERIAMSDSKLAVGALAERRD